MATNPRKNPCPTCGSIDKMTVRVGERSLRHVLCKECGYIGPTGVDAKQAIYAHNRETPPATKLPEVSNVSVEFIIDRMTPEPNTGCWIWMLTWNVWGYGQAKIGGETIGAHRASWIAHNGPIPDDLWVLHKCDVPCCVNPHHLYLGDAADNTRDAMERGRLHRWGGTRRGSMNPRAKLTDMKVSEIRELSGDLSAKELANIYGVSAGTIQDISSGRRWTHDQ